MSKPNLVSVPSKMLPLAATRGHQCPDCFTFNWIDRLPDDRKRRHQGKMLITCALCRSEYPAEGSQKQAA